jgi:hypothetical protein
VCPHHFEIPGLKPDATITVDSQDDAEKHQLFLYSVPLVKAAAVAPKAQ